MRLQRLAFRGLTRFKDPEPVRIDFDALGRGLIALVGRNGEGKTTVLEATAAALYGRFPTRPGSLYGYAHGEDAFIEAEFLNSEDRIKVRFQVDAQRRSIERYLYVNGETVTTGRAREFQEQVSARFGSLDLFLAAPFAAQNKEGNFLQQDRAARKDLFAEMLMLGPLQKMSDLARAHGAEDENALALVRATLADGRARAEQRPAIEHALAEAVAAVERAAGRLETAREEEASATATLERAKAHEPRVKALRDGLATARQAVTSARDAGQKAIAAARRAAEEAGGKESAAMQEAERRRKALALLDPGALEAAAKLRHTDARALLANRRESLGRVIDELPAVLAAESRLSALESALVALGDLERAEDAEDVANNAALATVDRLRGRTDMMKDAPCVPLPGRGGWVSQDLAERIQDGRKVDIEARDFVATCPFLKDARDAKQAIAAVSPDPAKVKAADDAREVWASVREAIHAPDDNVVLYDVRHWLEGELRVTRAVVAKRAAVSQAQSQLVAVDAEREALDGRLRTDLAEVATAKARKESEAQAIEDDLQLALLAAGTAVRDATTRLQEANAHAEASATAAAAQFTVASAALAEAEKDAPPPVAQAEVQKVAATAERQALERALRNEDANKAKAEADLGAVDAVIAGMKEQEEQEARFAQDVSDWGLLERTLGRNGVQALEIDAAGPEVSRLTNDLLLGCHSGRFSIAFETLREKSSAPGQFSEVFDVRVYDHGAERAVEALSGGEKVVVGEAVGLAISIFNARKNGVRWRTLFRDETAGALHPEDAHAYVDMLRRALNVGGFDQVLFVSHSPEVWQRADARLLVEGGRVTAEVPA